MQAAATSTASSSEPEISHYVDVVDTDLFRALLRRHAAAVVVITAPGEPPAGFTATSFTSVSLDPPLVSFCLAHTASAWPAVEAAGVVAVHVLTQEQEQVARTFSTKNIDRFATHGTWRPGPGGVPLLDGVLARIVCRVVQRVEAGDHTIVLAAPETGWHHEDSSVTPLVYHDGHYAHLRHAA
ncbi:flavin reductase family protein [Actinoplanes sp. M2I2]|uniref:flavin reductase family protein n=1 Tax=Actinoplanes sp. M2I2 TaxID=1734444 RepID=UPI0020215BE6|nr:flavin reductase family protein [Actinoplanes sp. M2I2]